jgi:hypothetical protein
LRAIILAVAVAVGVIGLTKAFPEGSSPINTSTGTPGVSPSPTPSVSRPTSPTPSTSPRVKDVVVQVLNGSGVDFLAAQESKKIKRAGYTVKTPGNANHTPTTIVYYQAGFQLEAEALQEKFYPDASVRRATQAAASDADLTVILGEDASPSPSG